MPAEDPFFVQVPRSVQGPGPTPLAHPHKWGIQRSNLTLWLSMAALILSLSSAGVSLFIFLRIGLRLMEADVALKQAEVAVQLEVARKEHSLANAAEKDLELKIQQIQESIAATANHQTGAQKNREESDLIRSQKRDADVKAELSEQVVRPLLPVLRRGSGAAATGEGLGITIPTESIVPNADFGTGQPAHPFGEPSRPWQPGDPDPFGPKQGKTSRRNSLSRSSDGAVRLGYQTRATALTDALSML
jgi:hypothetical protein